MELKPRHFEKSEKIIVRSKGDLSDVALARKSKSFEILLDAKSLNPKPQNPQLINSVEGRIKHLFLTIPKYAVLGEGNPYWKAYADLLSKLPGHTKLFIITHYAVKDELSELLQQIGVSDRVELSSIPDHLHFSVWAQDGYAITKDAEGIYFAEPFSFPRYADGLIAEFASNLSALENYQAPLYFQGGNILIGDNFFFIGADYPTNSLQYVNSVITPEPNETSAQLVKRLYKEYLDTSKEILYIGSKIPVPSEKTVKTMINGEEWKQVLYMGNKEGTVQPLFHIDMFLSLAGRNADGKYQILMGDPRMAAELLNFPESLKYSMPEVFDNIAANLAKNPQFEIIRNPLPLVYMDDVDAKTRYWYFATANNCLVENHTKGKAVWLPTYGYGNWKNLSVTDNKNKEVWESLGYTVNFLTDFHPFAENLGAVHCITKFLERDIS